MTGVQTCALPIYLVLNFDYEVPSEPGNGGPGFDVDVDDWDDVNMDIVL